MPRWNLRSSTYAVREGSAALLDGPLRVWRETAEAGLGLLASRVWI
ncbi:hypothetical protein AB0E27_16555 [Streptomyces sparsogenes]